MPRDFTVELNCAVADRLDEGQKIRLANEVTRFSLSSILHGEQGALSLSASLVHDPARPGRAGVRREPGARGGAPRDGVRALHRSKRWGTPLACGTTLANLMNELVLAPEVYKKLVGMQMLIEGLAMGAFATLHSRTERPAAAPRRPARDDRRGLPPPLRQDLGRPHRAEAHRGGAREGRGLGGEVLPDAALQPGERRAEAGDLPAVRARLAVGARRGDGGVHRRRSPPHDEARAPTSSAC